MDDLIDIPKFMDARFESLIRNTLNKPTGEITGEDMAQIEKIEGENLEITDVSGIEYCCLLYTSRCV